jgi:hypothetical protein
MNPAESPVIMIEPASEVACAIDTFITELSSVIRN